MNDTAGVIAPPPLIALGAVVLGLALDWLAPAYILTVLLPFETRLPLGLLLIVLGCLMAYGGIRGFTPICAIRCMSGCCSPSAASPSHWRRTGRW
jgi:hypothetical protein